MDSAGYSVAVVATEDDITVESNGDLKSLHQGRICAIRVSVN